MKISSSSHDQDADEEGGGCPVVARRGGACGEEEGLPHVHTHPRYVTAVVHNNKSNSKPRASARPRATLIPQPRNPICRGGGIGDGDWVEGGG